MQNRRRQARASIAPTNSQAMNISCIVVAGIRPIIRIVKLKLYCACGTAGILRQEKKPGTDISSDASRLQVFLSPKRHAPSFQPSGGFLENIHHYFSVFRRRLPDL